MKSVLISTQPKWCEKICHEIGTDKSGKPIYEKSIEVRKTKSSIPTPFKAYIYCTKAKSQGRYSDYEGAYENSEGKIVYAQRHVIGEFICDKVDEYTFSHYEAEYRVTHVEQKAMCLNQPELIRYGKGKTLYGWHISQLKIYDKPKELSEFYKIGAKSLEELDNDELCRYCAPTNYGERRVHIVPNAGAAFCEGDYCEEAYQKYLEQNFALTRPPQSWCYVEE